MLKICTLLFTGALIFSCCHPIEAQELTAPQKRSLVAIDYLCGYGGGEISDKDDTKTFPVALGLDFDLLQTAHNINIYPPGLLRFRVEPFFAYMAAPSSNIEAGVGFQLKIGFLPETYRFQPYFLAGPGFIYMTLQTREQADQLNFMECGSLGAHYFLNTHWAVTAEYRYRHISNGNIKKPNKGIEATFLLVGATYKF